jgi:hypothetical protein
MNDSEREEIQKLLEQELEEENEPDWQQYANLKWNGGEK